MFWYLSTFILERISNHLAQISKKRQYSKPLWVSTKRNSVPWTTIHTNSTVLGCQYNLNPGRAVDVLGPGHRVWRILHGSDWCDHWAVWDLLRRRSCYFPGCGRVRAGISDQFCRYVRCQIKRRFWNYRRVSGVQCAIRDRRMCLELPWRGSPSRLVSANERLYFLCTWLVVISWILLRSKNTMVGIRCTDYNVLCISGNDDN